MKRKGNRYRYQYQYRKIVSAIIAVVLVCGTAAGIGGLGSATAWADGISQPNPRMPAASLPGSMPIEDIFNDQKIAQAVASNLGESIGATVDQTRLDTITSLSVFNSNVSDLGGLEYLRELQELQMYGNKITDLSPLAGLTKLTTLYLYSNQISDITPLTNLDSLTRLNLFKNQIIDITPLAGLKDLQELYLTNNQISDITSLAGLSNLKRLSLYSNQISDVTPLVGLDNLEHLYLYNNRIWDLSPIQGKHLTVGSYKPQSVGLTVYQPAAQTTYTPPGGTTVIRGKEDAEGAIPSGTGFDGTTFDLSQMGSHPYTTRLTSADGSLDIDYTITVVDSLNISQAVITLPAGETRTASPTSDPGGRLRHSQYCELQLPIRGPRRLYGGRFWEDHWG